MADELKALSAVGMTRLGKPDCGLCGKPFHRHTGGSPNYCPIVAAYRPSPAPIAADPDFFAENANKVPASADAPIVSGEMVMDLPEAFEAWWATSPKHNPRLIGYSDKKCLAFDAFEAAAAMLAASTPASTE